MVVSARCTTNSGINVSAIFLLTFQLMIMIAAHYMKKESQEAAPE